MKRFILSAGAALALGALFLTGVAEGAGPAAKGNAANGKTVYQTNCASCHGATGMGQPGVFPPLAHSDIVNGDPKKVVAIVANGLTGSVTVNGKTYNGQMPAWKGQLSNQQIADVVTYIRTAWGNKGSAVTTADVAAAKK